MQIDMMQIEMKNNSENIATCTCTQAMTKNRTPLTNNIPAAAAAAKILYPDLSEHLSTTQEASNHPKKLPPATHPSSVMTANVGRRRSTKLKNLTNTPPRPSSAAQMNGVFAHSSPTRAGFSLMSTRGGSGLQENRYAGLNAKPRTPLRSAWSKEANDTWSPATSCRHLFDRQMSHTSRDENPLNDLVRAAAAPKDPTKYCERSVFDHERVARLQPTVSHPEHEAAVTEPKHLYRKSSPSRTQRTATTRDSIEASSPTKSDYTSSEEWTGDEDFLPRSARRRHREQRLAERGMSVSSTPVPQPALRLAPVATLPSPLRSPRASRFQSCQQPSSCSFQASAREEVSTTRSESAEEEDGKQVDSGVSDADDEDDSSGF